MTRSLALALAAVASVGTLALAACTPGERYVDQVFSSASVSTAVYKTTTDLTSGAPLALRADVYQPSGDTLGKRPAIVWVHGGGFKAGGRSDLAKVATAYARRGYVTLSIDYRLDKTNRCQDLQDGKIADPDEAAAMHARCERVITAAQDDALGAVLWLRLHAATYKVDTTRIAVGGSSAGAVTAVNVAQRANPDHGVVPSGYRVGAALAMSGCQYDPPAIDAHDAPISMLASGGDQAVPFECSTATIDAAAALGTPVQRLYYPKESGHALGLYQAHQAVVDKAWTAFLKARLHL